MLGGRDEGISTEAYKVNTIVEDYKAMWACANELAEKEEKTYPLKKYEGKWDRYSMHMIDMLTMYGIKNGEE
jgi:hypothetical protein